MGLDCFITRAPEKFSRDINLCGGMFSANGDSYPREDGDGFQTSFRGEVYDDFVGHVTNTLDAPAALSLYETLDTDDMLRLADAIQAYLVDYADAGPEDAVFVGNTYGWETSKQEALDLETMFREAAAIPGSTCEAWY